LAGGGTFELLASGSKICGIVKFTRAVIVHASPDDLKTDPTGNSAGCVGCGVIGG
jgi:Cu-Zn family superoxide dismutase